ncbi:MAG: hypothetical protein ACTSRB_10600 [Candidatus Helarchaeota archaeon]
MIYDLFIITEGGLGIYHKSFAHSTIDDQLLSGFLTAISDFSKETMGEKLSKIDVQTEQLVIHFDRTLKITIAALASQKDNLSLIKKTLMEIAEAFYLQFKDYLLKGKLDISVIREKFDPTVEQIVENKIRKRGWQMDLLGLAIGGLILVLFSFITINFLSDFLSRYFFTGGTSYEPLTNLFNFASITARLQFFLLIGIVPSAIAIGYISGSSKWKHAFGLTLILVGTFLVSNWLLGFVAGQAQRARVFELSINAITINLIIILYLPLYLLSCFIFIYIGGLSLEKRYFYPIPPEKEILYSSGKKQK